AKGDLRNDGRGVSGQTGQGLESLIEEIAGVLSRRAAEATLIGHERQRTAIARAAEAVAGAITVLETPEIAAEELRRALRAL
ncbi:UNVERIFIED_CONTAM: tRNA uridine-5-carboxymethylaminomethyl(34) synthesis GTPase MnmE, partial [Escherichia coli]